MRLCIWEFPGKRGCDWDSAVEIASKRAMTVALRGVGEGLEMMYVWIMDESVDASMSGVRNASRSVVGLRLRLILLLGWGLAYGIGLTDCEVPI
jgi:hypothetical protein